jgi:hypothetical protein
VAQVKFGGEFMLGVRVEISRYADAAQPGWVECRLVDAFGHEHVFVEKVPAVTEAHLDAASGFPQAGFIACIVVAGTSAMMVVTAAQLWSGAPPALELSFRLVDFRNWHIASVPQCRLSDPCCHAPRKRRRE